MSESDPIILTDEQREKYRQKYEEEEKHKKGIADIPDSELPAANYVAKNLGDKKKKHFDALFSGAKGMLDIANTDYPPKRWAIKGLLPRGDSGLFSGGSKIGKSWLAIQTASGVSLGTPFLGNPDFPCEKGEVLLLMLQLSGRQIHERMEAAKILADNGAQVVHRWPRGDDALKAVGYWKMKHPACSLVIIDMLEQVRARDPDRENSYSANVLEIAKWSRLAQELDISILGLTHNRKAATSDFVTDIMGSIGSVGSSGIIWSLKRSRGQADAVLSVTGWDIADQELPLVFDEATAWRLLEGTAAERQQSQERDEILEVLATSDEPVGPKDIATVLNKNVATVRWLLAQLKKEGQIINPARGKYASV